MNPRNKAWLSLVIFIAAMAIIACSCSSLSNAGVTKKSEPIPGLAGKWEASGFDLTFTFAWDGANYQVTTRNSSTGENYQVSGVSVYQNTLGWNYYDKQYSVLVNMVAGPISGDTTTAFYTAGSDAGSMDLSRVP